jgi:integrase
LAGADAGVRLPPQQNQSSDDKPFAESGSKTDGRSGQPQPRCPQCGSDRLYKDGLRYLSDGSTVQRYLCRNCGYRFSETHLNFSNKSQQVQKIQTLILNSPKALTIKRQGSREAFPGKASTSLGRLVKTLAEVETRNEKRAAGATSETTDIKGKILEFAWWLRKEGYADSTIELNVKALRILHERGAELYNPESVKTVIAQQRWSQNRRKNVINAYDLFAKYAGLRWDKPKCQPERKIPFIPTEQELDALIAGSGKKLSTLLQLLKETGMRVGEARRLHWTDVDFQKRVIILNDPEKGGNPRIFNVSQTLINMLSALPKKTSKIFGESPNALKASFFQKRKALAVKLQNPRLMRISFHTFRHWKATVEYHKTKDILHVKKLLGHKRVENTEIYIDIEQALYQTQNDEFHVKVASKPEEIKALLEVGFEYVCEKDGLLFFRKRK